MQYTRAHETKRIAGGRTRAPHVVDENHSIFENDERPGAQIRRVVDAVAVAVLNSGYELDGRQRRGRTGRRRTRRRRTGRRRTRRRRTRGRRNGTPRGVHDVPLRRLGALVYCVTHAVAVAANEEEETGSI